MLFDSAFLIQLSGQRGSRERTEAERFLGANPDAPLYTSRICWAEFAEGCGTPAEVESALHLFAMIEVDEKVAWSASRIARDLRGHGLHIGDNDVWIAATALAFGLPLVSRNARHFSRVAGLEVVAY